MQERTDLRARDWRRPVWLSLLVAASVAFTLGFACATPLAAFCAVTVCTLPRRDAYCLAGAVWLANQLVGFAFLHYPWTANSLEWGVALGLTALVCTLAAHLTIARLQALHPVARNAVVFLAAFATYEAMLIAFSLWLGGVENFTAEIQLKIFGLNVLALVGLFALHWAGSAIGIASAAETRPLACGPEGSASTGG